MKFKIKDSFADAGKTGVTLGDNILCKGGEYTPVVLDGTDFPVFIKSHTIEACE